MSHFNSVCEQKLVKSLKTVLLPQNEMLQTLVRLGLTCRQAKVYCALANLGKAKVKTVSEVSEVPRQHIYQVMSKLYELGLVHKVITAPITFEAISLREGLSILLNNKVHETFDLQVKTRNILQNLIEKNIAETTRQKQTRQFILVSEKATKRRVTRNIKNTKTSIDVVCTWDRYLNGTYTYLAEYKKALKRGVRFRQVTELPKDKESFAQARKIKQILKKYPSNQTRYHRSSITTVVALMDKKEVFMATSPTNNIEGSPGLWSNNICLIELAQNYFDAIWLMALREIPE